LILFKDTSGCGIPETTRGFRTVIERFTEGDGLTVIILCNRTDPIGKLALQIAGYYPPLK